MATSLSITIPTTQPKSPLAGPAAEDTSNVRVRDTREANIKVNSGDLLAAARPKEGVFATAVDHTGTPTLEINDKTKYVVTGPQGAKFTISAANAVIQGLLVKNSDGSYSDPNATTVTADDVAAKDPDKAPELDPKVSDDPLPLSGEVDVLESEIYGALKADGIDTDTFALNFIRTGSLDAAAVQFAKSKGVTSEEFHANLLSIHSAHEARVTEFFTKKGLDAAAVFEWESKNRTRAAATAGRLNTLRNDFRYWKDLAENYANINPFGLPKVLPADVESKGVIRKPTGDVAALKMRDGRVIPLSHAKLAGIF